MSKTAIECPHCGHPETRVHDTRPSLYGGKVIGTRRRRICAACGARFTTLETVVVSPLSATREADQRRRALIASLHDAADTTQKALALLRAPWAFEIPQPVNGEDQGAD